MKDKYIDEAIPTYFIFGEKDGFVDVADSEGDILTNIKKDEAERLIRDRWRIQEVLYFLIGDDYKKYEEARRIYSGDK